MYLMSRVKLEVIEMGVHRLLQTPKLNVGKDQKFNLKRSFAHGKPVCPVDRCGKSMEEFSQNDSLRLLSFLVDIELFGQVSLHVY